MSGMVGTEGAGRLLGPAFGGVLGAWSIRMPFVVHGALAFLAIVPSFFLVRESAPIENKGSNKNGSTGISVDTWPVSRRKTESLSGSSQIS